MTNTVHHRTCPLCEATCGLEIEVVDGAIKRVRGDRADVFSAGYICPKGSTVRQLHEDPDRIRVPMVRRDGVLTEATWDEAFAEIERRLGPIQEASGRDSVALYLGNPSAHTIAGTLFGRPLIQALGTKNLYSASTVDQMPKHVSCGFLFGNPGAIPVPDLDRTDYLLMLGADPLESNGSLCTAPDFPGRLDRIRDAAGGSSSSIPGAAGPPPSRTSTWPSARAPTPSGCSPCSTRSWPIAAWSSATAPVWSVESTASPR